MQLAWRGLYEKENTLTALRNKWQLPAMWLLGNSAPVFTQYNKSLNNCIYTPDRASPLSTNSIISSTLFVPRVRMMNLAIIEPAVQASKWRGFLLELGKSIPAQKRGCGPSTQKKDKHLPSGFFNTDFTMLWVQFYACLYLHSCKMNSSLMQLSQRHFPHFVSRLRVVHRSFTK